MHEILKTSSSTFLSCCKEPNCLP